MIQRPMVNFRGQNALLMMAEDGNARRLRDILDKLGFFVSRCDVSSEDPRIDFGDRRSRRHHRRHRSSGPCHRLASGGFGGADYRPYRPRILQAVCSAP